MRKMFYVVGGIVAAAVLLAVALNWALWQPGVQRRIVAVAISHAIDKAARRTALVDEPGLKVLLCGTASPLPNSDRAGPCAAIIANGKIWLVDVGGGSWKNLMLWQLPGERVSGVFLTHFHSDHIQDLGEVNLQSWGVGRPGKLPVIGGPGVDKVAGGFLAAYALDQTYRTAHHGPEMMPVESFPMVPVVVAAAGGGPLREGETALAFEQDGLKVTAIGVNHFPVTPAYAYRFDYHGRSVVISGDTKFSPTLAVAAKGADVIVHEAQAQNLVAMVGEAMRGAGKVHLAHIFADIPSYHTAPTEAAEIANRAGAKLLLLTHLTPPLPTWLAERVFMTGVTAIRPSGTLVGHDGLLVSLPAGSEAVEVQSLD
jgi:ribonuclease Z